MLFHFPVFPHHAVIPAEAGIQVCDFYAPEI